MLLPDYKFIQNIGAGGSAIVYLAECRETGELCAIKRVNKLGLSVDKLDAVREEIQMMKSIDHPFIVSFYDWMEDDRAIYIVMEYCEGGTLYDLIHRETKLPELQASVIATELILALDYLHREAGIIHRDIKPENILLDPNGHIRLTDLGFGTCNKTEDAKMRTACGSPSYVAPEIIKREPYTSKVDVWSTGVVMYAMLTGTVPFRSETHNIAEILKNICEQPLNVPDHVSDQAREILVRALDKCSDTRITLQGLLAHPWIMQKEHFQKICETLKYVRGTDRGVVPESSIVPYRIHRDLGFKTILATRIGSFSSGYICRQIKAFGVQPTKSCQCMTRASFRPRQKPIAKGLPKVQCTTLGVNESVGPRRTSRCIKVIQRQLMCQPVKLLTSPRPAKA